MGRFTIRTIQSEEDAKRVVEFFLSEQSFDDMRHTPGELEHFNNNPYKALQGEHFYWLAENEAGDIVGVNSATENEQKTGGFLWDYVVVHQSYRNDGIASALIDRMINHLLEKKARYVITYTCDLPEYGTIRRMFERNGFAQIGRCPDYYYDHEDRLIYYRKLS